MLTQPFKNQKRVYFSESILGVTLPFNYKKETWCERRGGVGSELPYDTLVSPLKGSGFMMLHVECAYPSQKPSPVPGQSHSPLAIFCSS